MTSPAAVPDPDHDPDGAHANVLTEVNDTLKTMQGSSVSEDSQISEDDISEPPDGFEPVLSRRTRKKRKKHVCNTSSSSSDTIINDNTTSPRLTVIFSPIETSQVWKFNALKLSEKLEGFAPDGIMQIRLNKRLNLIAVDTRNTESTTALLAITSLCGAKVRAYEPRPVMSTVGVIKDVDDAISEQDLLLELRHKVPITQVRRLGKSRSVRLTFSTAVLPQHVYVGKVRFPVDTYEDHGVQCRNCGLFGHVAAVCYRKQVCLRCTGNHPMTACEASSPCCINCGGPHESFSKSCSAWKVETNIRRYKKTHNVSFATARTAVVNDGGHSELHPSIILHNRFSTLDDGTLTEDAVPADQGFPFLPSFKPPIDGLRGSWKNKPPSMILKDNNDSRQTATGHSADSTDIASSSQNLLKNTSSQSTSSDKHMRSAPTSRIPVHDTLQQKLCHDSSQMGSSSNIFGDTLLMIAEAVKNLLSSMSSPLARLAVSVIDVIMPLIAKWGR